MTQVTRSSVDAAREASSSIARPTRNACPSLPVLDLDRAHPHVEQLARLAHPRQAENVIAAAPAEHDPPREDAEADPVGGPPARDSADCPAWTDGVAVARLENTRRRCASSQLRDRNTARMTIDPRVDIGHVHLKVADLDRALEFWHGIIGFDITHRYGDEAAFLSAGGYHHHIGLNTWESKGGSPPPPGTTGLFHVAVRFPDRRTLAEAVKRLLEAGIRLDGASDHGVSEAIYLRDPDGNGVELYCDRPREQWPPDMYTAPLDLRALLAEASPA
jgi:catechol 2,3-dioxygenase